MTQSSAEEMEVIKSIFEDEIEDIDVDAGSFRFSPAAMSSSTSSAARIAFQFQLTANYPTEAPVVSCFQMSRPQFTAFMDALARHVEALIGEPMLMSILLWIRENMDAFLGQQAPSASPSAPSTPFSAFLHLDHMRARNSYTRLIKEWCHQLALAGRILFSAKGAGVFIVLQGTEDGIKEYIKRNRTQRVDVDSSGKPCKERLLSVLFSGQLNECERFASMEEVECTDKKHMSDLLREWQLELFATMASSGTEPRGQSCDARW